MNYEHTFKFNLLHRDVSISTVLYEHTGRDSYLYPHRCTCRLHYPKNTGTYKLLICINGCLTNNYTILNTVFIVGIQYHYSLAIEMLI